jgi:hypothetical protein
MPRKRLAYHGLPATLAMCAPAVRMVVVDVWANQLEDGSWDDADHAIYPVLAILAKQEHRYVQPFSEQRPPDIAPTSEAMESLGWRYESRQAIAFDVVVNSPEHGVCDGALAFGGSNEGYRAVACPWPPEEDPERLAPIIDELRAEARAKAEREALVRREAT